MKEISIVRENRVAFKNHVDDCIGTGRMGLALQSEYMDQLKLVQDEIGFSHIRGHGLFADDMAIYHEYENENGETCVEYNFTYLDLVMDKYLELGLKPFIELGFMPYKLASGTQTVFYWKGNTTPPKDYDMWCDLVKATLSHLMDRYGADEVVTWPVEVWNEPNLPGFWEKADMQEYFKLFKYSFYAVKEVDARFRVGGPAICGVDDENWIRSFMTFCREEKIPVDFVTRHHYTTELPDDVGHYGYQQLSNPEDGFKNLQSTRDIVDSFEEFADMEIHITEFNTSYIPNNPLHDTNLNAAFIAHQLSRLGDMNESYSYWTFGDIFEERGVPFTPFHGGFGLVANGGIPKPTFWSFKFFKDLIGACVFRNDDVIVTLDDNGIYHGVAWNPAIPGRDAELDLLLHLPMGMNGSEVCVTKKIVDEETCNPLKIWHALGEPSSLTEKQKDLLKSSARPYIEAERIVTSVENVSVSLKLRKNGLVYFEVEQITPQEDRGYSYERVIRGE
ncbi:MAG: glycosyl hydrolase [Eubacteriales bacterium]|nr:glycosyl hydrolase [Eubacteriales bacterium]